MYIQVRLLNGFQKSLTYRLPQNMLGKKLSGSIVQVPLRNRVVYAFVEDQFETFAQQPSFEIREITSISPFPHDTNYIEFLEHVSAYHQIPVLDLIKRMHSFVRQKEIEAEPQVSHIEQSTTVVLTDEQQAITTELIAALNAPSFYPALIHGVTGSGKTEVYKKIIIQNFQNNKTSLLLLPEVTLALQFERELKRTLSKDIHVLSFHSASSVATKRTLWNALLNNRPIVIVGVHLPVLLPISNLGLIIVDEEHEVGYQEKKHPKVNTKELAILRAQHYKIPIILGSATPSITSLYNTQCRGWKLFELTNRYRGEFPTVSMVNLKEQPRRRNFWISKDLEKAITQRLADKEQVIIFINRRGFSFFVQCKDCSHVFCCASCSVSLTLHQQDDLVCHYCGFKQKTPVVCPACHKSAFIKKGIGTQQVVSILQQMFPIARVGRADMDQTINRKGWQETLGAFERKELDILVGTQTITKGYHFPSVTLVGILWADLNLNIPFYTAAETTLQQLIQVAGRAGRASSQSQVIVQIMQDHEVFNHLNEQNYKNFYRYELQTRKMFNYPPFVRFCEIELVHSDEKIIDDEAIAFTALLHKKNTSGVTILGPAHPPVEKIKNSHRRKIYLKSPSITEIIQLFKSIKCSNFSSRIFFTPNPLG
jgi:primosomal protein N' (replication factor Y)